MRRQKAGHYILLVSYSTLTNKKTCIQFFKFAAVGLLNTGLQYCVFYVLYSLFGVYYLTASAVGYCVGMCNSFLLNKTWTFKSFNTRTEIQFIKFVLINACALIVNLVVLKIIVTVMSVQPELGQVVAIVFSTLANFLGNKFWTFR